jgi:hypothetical protein
MTLMVSSRNAMRDNLWSRIQALSISRWGTIGLALLAGDFYLHAMLIPATLTLLAIPLTFPMAMIHGYKFLEHRWNRAGGRRFMAFSAFTGLLATCTLTLLLTTIHPEAANAQFFKNAETWMKGKFTGADKAIEIIFNVLRGLFLIYLGISLVKVIQAARQDQDWQDLARTPLIIVVAVALGDILSTFIVGGA